MKVLKIIGIVVIVIVALVIILGLIAPNEYTAERRVVIDAPKELVFNHVKYWRNWQAWSPWAAQDSAMVVEVRGIDGEVGSVYSWVGDPQVTGKGEMTNTGLKPFEEILFDLHFIEPYESYSTGWVRLTSAGEGRTEAAWGFSGEMAFPTNIMLLFSSMDDMIGPDFDRGLALLKKICEQEYAEVSKYQVEEVEYPERIFAAVREVVPMSDMQPFFARAYATIAAEIGKARARMTGSPCAFFYVWDEQHGETETAAAIPVNRVISSEVIQMIQLPARRAFKVDYYGPYGPASAPAHMALDLYLAQHGLEQVSPVIEEYVTDPQTEPDPAKWLTRIYYFGE
jgi:effector-binding domain-containing protein